jgi:hypothetical protein
MSVAVMQHIVFFLELSLLLFVLRDGFEIGVNSGADALGEAPSVRISGQAVGLAAV